MFWITLQATLILLGYMIMSLFWCGFFIVALTTLIEAIERWNKKRKNK